LRALNKKSPTTGAAGQDLFVIAGNGTAPVYARRSDSRKMEVPAMPPLALTDSELDAVYRAAGPIPPAVRGAFLEEVAQRLAGRELGDGVVYRVVMEVQRRYWSPPDLARTAGTSKYR
jgi:hypothetical protein